MISLESFLKINFLSGVIGALITTPLFLLYDLFRGKSVIGDGSFLYIGAGYLLGAFFAGLLFFVSGLLAYPVVRLLHKNGYVKNFV